MASSTDEKAPPAPGDGQEGAAEPIYIGPWAYLRSMGLILWYSFRHPLTTTTIDLATGEVISDE
jgi:hypothetical protein